jgi:uncharacterized membrane protein (DUF4010 family)
MPVLWWHLARSGTVMAGRDPLKNPTQLGTALLFAAFYALILISSAWLSDIVGTGGLYALSFISGLTDVDAITLSSARLAGQGNVAIEVAATAIALAVLANLVFKATVSVVVGGRALGRAAVIGFALPLAGLVAGLLARHALA